jgi:protocatechuate 3,4-dioxygenase beta subunit
LQGRVTDDAGTPVEDATVALEDEAGRDLYLFSLVTTGSDGRYNATGLAPGRYIVKLHAKGYAPVEVPVTLDVGGGTADGVLARGGAIEVAVQDPNGQPLMGAWVTLTDDQGHPVRRTLSLVNLDDPSVGRTGADGRVKLRDLAPGRYRVEASLSGHALEGDAPFVTVTPAGTATTGLVLTPAGR